MRDIDTAFWPSPRYNIAPGQEIATILNTTLYSVTPTRWGLIPPWAESPAAGYRLINARVESIHEKPSFKRPFAKQRCLITANGFYEWNNDPSTKRKIPYFFQLKTGEMFCFAGLWDTWKSPENDYIISSSIITTEANETVSLIHHRMPLILKPESYKLWLSQEPIRYEDLFSRIACYDGNDFKYYEVTREVNSPSFDNPDAIKEI